MLTGVNSKVDGQKSFITLLPKLLMNCRFLPSLFATALGVNLLLIPFHDAQSIKLSLEVLFEK
jgi:hypothetical protein